MAAKTRRPSWRVQLERAVKEIRRRADSDKTAARRLRQDGGHEVSVATMAGAGIGMTHAAEFLEQEFGIAPPPAPRVQPSPTGDKGAMQ